MTKVELEKRVEVLEALLAETTKAKEEAEDKLAEQQRNKLVALENIQTLYYDLQNEYGRLEVALERAVDACNQQRSLKDAALSDVEFYQGVANDRRKAGEMASRMLREVGEHHSMPASIGVRNFILASVAAMLEGDFHPYNNNNNNL